MSSRIAEQVPEHGARTPFVSAKKAATPTVLQVLYFSLPHADVGTPDRGQPPRKRSPGRGVQ